MPTYDEQLLHRHSFPGSYHPNVRSHKDPSSVVGADGILTDTRVNVIIIYQKCALSFYMHAVSQPALIESNYLASGFKKLSASDF